MRRAARSLAAGALVLVVSCLILLSMEMAVSWTLDSELQNSALRIVEEAGGGAASIRLDERLLIHRESAPTGSIRDDKPRNPIHPH